MEKFMLFLCCCLLWPISNASAGALEQGIKYFQKKDYTRAKKLWLPLAKDGDVRAQYNLVVLHKQQSKKKVEDKAQRKKASKYLAMSRSEGLVDAYYVSLSDSAPAPASVPTLVSTPVSKPVSTPVVTLASIPAAKAVQKTNISKPLDWLNQQQKNTYTLQLATGKNRNSVEDMQKKLLSSQTLKQPGNLYVHKIETQDKGKSDLRYVLIYGIFKTYEEAKNAVGQLPESIQKSSPWIRQFGALQSIVNAGQKNKET